MRMGGQGLLVRKKSGRKTSASGTPQLQKSAPIVHGFNNFLTPIMNILTDLQQQKVGGRGRSAGSTAQSFAPTELDFLGSNCWMTDISLHCHPSVVHIDELLARLEPILAGSIRPDITLRIETAANLPPIQ